MGHKHACFPLSDRLTARLGALRFGVVGPDFAMELINYGILPTLEPSGLLEKLASQEILD